jgi:hypothetical protein
VAYDQELDARVSEVVGPWDTERKRMFGGTGYLLGGNMLAGVHKDSLILRLGEGSAAPLLLDPRARVFDITGRPMQGWVMVESQGIDDDELVLWLSAAKAFVEPLPPK